ncbi:hypothetical protein [Cetobacterium sp.]|uniref:hypothetical protein n=1 Tax=Cetobacterium sp. TaxID=2071632 RepID=UPI003F2DE202
MRAKIYLEEELVLEHKGQKYYTQKSIILTGGNARGKTKKLKKIETEISRIENAKYIQVSDISKKYIEELESLEEVGLGENEETKGLYKMIEDKREELEKNIADEFFNGDIKIKKDEEDGSYKFLYSNNDEITSNGQDNLIKLSILSLYYSEKGVKVLILDEPNTNLDDDNASNVIQGILNICNKSNDNKILIIASTNNGNMIEELEGCLVYNVDSEELCYSSDIIGNIDAIHRIISKYPSQKKLISKNREILTKILLKNKDWHSIEKQKYFIYGDKDDNGEYSVLEIEEFSKLEKIIYEKIYSTGKYTNKKFKIKPNKDGIKKAKMIKNDKRG